MAAETPVFLLCGGLGTRLRSHDAEHPKPLVPVLGRPFVAWLIEHLARSGYSRFVLSTGYLADQFESYPWKREFPALQVEFAREESPLGTGGAIAAWFQAQPPEVQAAWVINGDTWLDAGLPSPSDARAALGTHQDAFYLALERSEVFDARPNLEVTEDRLVRVGEGDASQYFDAGAVFLDRRALDPSPPPPPFSLHRAFGPAMAARRVGFRVVPGTCYDIGTPERIRRFEEHLRSKTHS